MEGWDELTKKGRGAPKSAPVVLERAWSGRERRTWTSRPAGNGGSGRHRTWPERPSREGPAGEVDEDAVYEAIEVAPGRVATAVQGSLDPDPTDVQAQLESLCSTLQLAPALEEEVISC